MGKLELGNIIPRWEWRTFGQNFGGSEELINQYKYIREVVSDEYYLLSSLNDNNCKIRNDLLDIKILKQVNREKLEQWTPHLKANFPIPRILLFEILNILGIETNQDLPGVQSIENLLQDILPLFREIIPVSVNKKRFVWQIDNCTVELSDLMAGGQSIRTVAVEHENPDIVISTVKQLELTGYENINYIRALKTLKGIVNRNQ